MTLKKSIFENIVKNILIIIILFLLWPACVASISNLDNILIDPVIKVVGFLLSGTIAGNLRFSYNSIDLENTNFRIFSHFVTAILLIAIGLMMEILILTINEAFKQLQSVKYFYESMPFIAILLLYISMLLYDWWDLLVSLQKKM